MFSKSCLFQVFYQGYWNNENVLSIGKSIQNVKYVIFLLLELCGDLFCLNIFWMLPSLVFKQCYFIYRLPEAQKVMSSMK